MSRVLPILFGAGFTVAACLGTGLVLLRRLRVVLDEAEEVLFSFLCGAAAVSTVVFFLCATHVARRGVFFGLGTVAIVCGLRRLPRVRFSARYLIFVPIFFMYFFIAVAPEVSPDGSGYHLGNVLRMYERHGFAWDYHSIYSAFPQGMEMLFLVAFALGGRPAAAVVHLAFLAALGGLLVLSGRRFGHPRAGWFAAVLVVASPVVGLVGSSAYNDVALATCIYAAFYAGEVCVSGKHRNLLKIVGLLAGFCFAIKYTGWIVAPLALVLLRDYRVAAGAVATGAPWLVRNWIWIGNPVAPFLNRWFPNFLYAPDLEAAYLFDLRHVEGLRHWWDAPVDLTIYGAKLPGFLGPVFLLAPIALLSLRYPIGRRLLLGFAVFSLPVWLNPGARFLIPALPFLALAMGIAMENSPGVLPAVAAFHCVLALPAVMPAYCADWAWRIREIPVRVALGLAPEEPYIRRFVPDYPIKALIEPASAKGQKIFSFSTLPSAYIDREIVVEYESAEGARIGEALRRGERISGVDLVLASQKEKLNSPQLTPTGERNGRTLYRVD